MAKKIKTTFKNTEKEKKVEPEKNDWYLF
jgi:hypothetical protein